MSDGLNIDPRSDGIKSRSTRGEVDQEGVWLERCRSRPNHRLTARLRASARLRESSFSTKNTSSDIPLLWCGAGVDLGAGTSGSDMAVMLAPARRPTAPSPHPAPGASFATGRSRRSVLPFSAICPQSSAASRSRPGWVIPILGDELSAPTDRRRSQTRPARATTPRPADAPVNRNAAIARTAAQAEHCGRSQRRQESSPTTSAAATIVHRDGYGVRHRPCSADQSARCAAE